MLAHIFGFLNELLHGSNSAPITAANAFNLHAPVRGIQPEFAQGGRFLGGNFAALANLDTHQEQA